MKRAISRRQIVRLIYICYTTKKEKKKHIDMFENKLKMYLPYTPTKTDNTDRHALSVSLSLSPFPRCSVNGRTLMYAHAFAQEGGFATIPPHVLNKYPARVCDGFFVRACVQNRRRSERVAGS